MCTTLKSIAPIVTREAPLEVLLQQCNNLNQYDPVTQFGAWTDCLNEVNTGQNYQSNATEWAEAIVKVWETEMTREILLSGIQSLVDQTGGPSFSSPLVYRAVNTVYPITVTILVDTEGLLATCDNTKSQMFNAGKFTTASDDNDDPNQNYNEITVFCKVGNKIRWVAKAKNEVDTVELTKFVHNREKHVFGDHPPTKQSDGAFEGTVIKAGHECYHYQYTVNNGDTTFTWDPFIMATV